MQLDQLLPEQISRNWLSISETVKRCLPPGAFFDEAACLKAMLSGDMQAWVLTDDGLLAGVATTMVLRDAILGLNQLLIYSAYSSDSTKMDFAAYRDAFPALERFARANGCREVAAYSSVAHLAEVARLMGFEQFHYFRKQVL